MGQQAQNIARRTRGSTLIEVLVAIVVLSVGLLGMVGLHAASLQSHREARLQSNAVRLGAELAERMRGNPAVAAEPDVGGNPYLQENTIAAPAKADVDCFAGSCTSAQAVARWDASEWLQRVFAIDGGLPGARVVVCFDQTPYDSDGLPRWQCSGSGDMAYVKLGWTRATTGRPKGGGLALDRPTDAGSRPGVVLPVASGQLS
ncbi:MAG: type IV pilus modification protein PilV [Janthinobacterium lividum]